MPFMAMPLVNRMLSFIHSFTYSFTHSFFLSLVECLYLGQALFWVPVIWG